MTSPATDCGVTAGCGACPLGRAGVCGDPGTAEPSAIFGLMTEYTRPLSEAVARRAESIGEAWAEVFRLALDTPDLDPAEPRPADAGCAGGCCTR